MIALALVPAVLGFLARGRNSSGAAATGDGTAPEVGADEGFGFED